MTLGATALSGTTENVTGKSVKVKGQSGSWISDPEQLSTFLDKEIEYIQERERRPGWTIWAFLGSLAAALWFLVNQLESPSLNLENIPALLLSFSLCMDGLLGFYTSLAPNTIGPTRTRFRWTSSLAESRPVLVSWLIRSALLVYLAWSISPATPASLTLFAVTSYGGLVFFALFGLILGFFRLPFPAPRESPVNALILLGFSLAQLCAAYGYFSHVLVNASQIGVADYKATGLTIVIIFLLFAMVRSNLEPPLISSLIQIRRDLAFGLLDADTALVRAEIAIAGLKVNDMLQEDVQAVLERLEQNDFLERDVVEKYQTIIATFLADADGEFDLGKMNAITFEMEKCGEALVRSSDFFQKGQRDFLKLIKRMSWMKRMAPDATQDIDSLFSSLRLGLQKVKSRTSQVREEFEVIRTRVNAGWERIHERLDELKAKAKVLDEKSKGDLSQDEAEKIRSEMSLLKSEIDLLSGGPNLAHSSGARKTEQGEAKNIAEVTESDSPEPNLESLATAPEEIDRNAG